MSALPWWVFAVAVAFVATATAVARRLAKRRHARRLVDALNAERAAGERAAAARKALGIPEPGTVDKLIDEALRSSSEQAWLRGEGRPPWEHS
ncbi:hypothetical protein ABT340_41375 [Streptosporangium sp. NPDC000239]|uniref:hypothetical protein n=1 Tax=Streptosporangium sp. NPDC000239 TaxID=3154248 RepID=UPI0033294B18